MASELLRANYVAQGLVRNDPWIACCAARDLPQSLGMAQGAGASDLRPAKGVGFFAKHGIRRMTVFPVCGGARPGGIVTYARDRAAVLCDRGREVHGRRWLRPIGDLRRICLTARTCALRGLFWRRGWKRARLRMGWGLRR